MDWLFSFSFQPRFASDEETLMNTVDFWNLFDCKEEFERMGLPSAQWRITDINAKLEVCSPSLPPWVDESEANFACVWAGPGFYLMSPPL